MEGERGNSFIKKIINTGLAVSLGAGLASCAKQGEAYDSQTMDNKPAVTAPLPDNASTKEEYVMPTVSVTPRVTETATSTATPESMSNRVEIDKSSVEALPYADLREVSDEDYVVIPKSANEYLLEFENKEGLNLDKAQLVVGQSEIGSVKTVVEKDGKEKVFYSLPRGTKNLSLKFEDGSMKEISNLLPEEEPGNKFLDGAKGSLTSTVEVR